MDARKSFARSTFALALSFPATEQAPSLKFPVHHVPAFFNGRQRAVDNDPNGNIALNGQFYRCRLCPWFEETLA